MEHKTVEFKSQESGNETHKLCLHHEHVIEKILSGASKGTPKKMVCRWSKPKLSTNAVTGSDTFVSSLNL